VPVLAVCVAVVVVVVVAIATDEDWAETKLTMAARRAKRVRPARDVYSGELRRIVARLRYECRAGDQEWI